MGSAHRYRCLYPHSAVTLLLIDYDANGNMTSRAGSTVSWFSNNYPATISASDATGSEEVQFTYGPDRQRWEQIYTGPSDTEKTYYIGGLVDLVFNGIINFRHYIYAGSEPIAVYIRTNSVPTTMNYMIEDHEGGVSVIASNAGASDIGESFTAFGQRRNPNSWSGAPATADLNTIAGLSRQGYTFQTWLGQSMGLNHMNGRVEDAILGRFLSPDPHIPDPTSAQSYNRYSYVNNNPLSYTDPTGFEQKFINPDGSPDSNNFYFTTYYAPNSAAASPANPITDFEQWLSAVTDSAADSAASGTSPGGIYTPGLTAPSDPTAYDFPVLNDPNFLNPATQVAIAQNQGGNQIQGGDNYGLNASDYIGALVGAYSTGTASLFEWAGIKSASFFGVQYGLPAVLSDLPGGTFSLIGAFQTGNAYYNGNYFQASQAGGATLGGIALGELLGAYGLSVGGPWGGAAGIVVGGLLGTFGGGYLGGTIYNNGFAPLDQPSPATPPFVVPYRIRPHPGNPD
jgi:RHS repeat-associated protein